VSPGQKVSHPVLSLAVGQDIQPEAVFVYAALEHLQLLLLNSPALKGLSIGMAACYLPEEIGKVCFCCFFGQAHGSRPLSGWAVGKIGNIISQSKVLRGEKNVCQNAAMADIQSPVSGIHGRQSPAEIGDYGDLIILEGEFPGLGVGAGWGENSITKQSLHLIL